MLFWPTSDRQSAAVVWLVQVLTSLGVARSRRSRGSVLMNAAIVAAVSLLSSMAFSRVGWRASAGVPLRRGVLIETIQGVLPARSASFENVHVTFDRDPGHASRCCTCPSQVRRVPRLRGYAGRVASGVLRPGDDVLAQLGMTSKIEGIESRAFVDSKNREHGRAPSATPKATSLGLPLRRRTREHRPPHAYPVSGSALPGGPRRIVTLLLNHVVLAHGEAMFILSRHDPRLHVWVLSTATEY